MIEEIKAKAKEAFEDVRSIRRHIHANPELSFSEFKTSEFVCSELDKLGVKYSTGYVKTGIVAWIEGRNPEKGTVALRGDMDALPIQETNDKSYKSLNDGVMHACGHDVHTSCLLGAARILNELRDRFEGKIQLIFQPGEELLPGGAKLMIEEGVFESGSPDTIIAQHVYPDLEVGKVGFKPGMYMASTDELHVEIKGVGGHAALPHKLIDPVLIASNIIVSLQQIVSRRNLPTMPSVLSFGYVKADGATNVIPDSVYLKGTFRTFDEKWRDEAHVMMKGLAESIAKGMGGECDFEIRRGYPFLVNDEERTLEARECAVEFLGEENVVDLSLRMTAEDFAYFSQVSPAVFYRLGIANEAKGINGRLHTSTFDIDEEALEIGMGLMAYSAVKRLGNL